MWLTVTDNGIGIPFAEQEKVFAKFYRATNLPDRNIPGIGLGLSYVKLITEAHRGNVSLSSHAAVSCEHVLSTIWGNESYANSLALNVQITCLRKALRHDTSVRIASLVKKGYVLTAP
ncbi:MAG: winged helix-turn-helix domain-containing protein [Tannerellaceae bacterium]|nr:winged helix-turn-helix domain-containing protein [Tannerellaceae bacterium]